MTDLKTLKDLMVSGTPNLVAKSILRDEAIKWVKELEKINVERYQEFCITCFKKVNSDEAYDCYKLNHFLATTDWEESSDFTCMIGIIKHFFNLSEEDLK